MTLLTDNYKNAKLILNDFPMIADVTVNECDKCATTSLAGLYDDGLISLMVPNLVDGFTLTHEYGHALSDWYTDRCHDIGKNNLPSHYFRRVAGGQKQLMTLEMRFASVTGYTRNDAPSKYGKTNWGEFGAECMRDYYAHGDKCAPVSKRYVELAKKWIAALC